MMPAEHAGATGALAAAGWRPGRRHNCEPDLRALRLRGWDPWPELVSFLAEFTRLVIPDSRPLPPEVARRQAAKWWGGRNLVQFGAEMVAGEVTERERAEYRRRTGTDMAPVGLALSEAAVVLMATDGRFYLAQDQLLWYAGDSPLAMVAALMGPFDAPVEVPASGWRPPSPPR
jgi:hypothetical protein